MREYGLKERISTAAAASRQPKGRIHGQLFRWTPQKLFHPPCLLSQSVFPFTSVARTLSFHVPALHISSSATAEHVIRNCRFTAEAPLPPAPPHLSLFLHPPPHPPPLPLPSLPPPPPLPPACTTSLLALAAARAPSSSMSTQAATSPGCPVMRRVSDAHRSVGELRGGWTCGGWAVGR